MSWYLFSGRKSPTNISYRKACADVLPFGLVLIFFTLAGCRNPSAKNLSEPFVASCAVTPELLKANTCVNFQKNFDSQCFLRLHGYVAPEETLKATEGELTRFFQDAEAFSKDVPGLAPQESQSLSYYTTRGHHTMNKALRGEASAFRTHKNIIYAAASGLNKLKKFEGTVYRTETLASSLLDSVQQTFKVGNIVVEEVFLSTTSRADFIYTSPSRGIHISYTIHSKTGRDLNPVSVLDFEAEVLFLPGTAFRVLSINQELGNLPPSSAGVPSIPPALTKLKIELEELDL